MPNIPETVVALLATSSLGAIWSSCSPDFGTRAVIDRFGQLEPKVLLTVDGYRYGGRDFDRMNEIWNIERALPSLKSTVVLPYLRPDAAPWRSASRMSWAELASETAPLEFAQLPFEHPLWVLYTSGTTGLPKGLVHSQGGILLEHLKSLALHQDLGADDRFFWFTTTGWMMWNYMLGVLPLGGTAVSLRRESRASGHGDALAFRGGRRRHVLRDIGRVHPGVHEGEDRARPRQRPGSHTRGGLDRRAARTGGLHAGSSRRSDDLSPSAA